ncbi:uncharacterized protein BDZ99DRAFT_499402 [Mytilinidion resinicola]|uniref:Gamma-glutamylcyclotransferase AIG2-like domain-containing protein n=1 Tax=Mytilinidion resinicola TaxID=574789 RepID=A0A6A6YKK3_9PEZI|nr:uncharacterized protein BDZ99DRAFT_499402 [Mytilinidion resinicola]KAF2809083.1 hypothetical protein BDZ99DRAFT_499402 [Mytilinidion resinicola]
MSPQNNPSQQQSEGPASTASRSPSPAQPTEDSNNSLPVLLQRAQTNRFTAYDLRGFVALSEPPIFLFGSVMFPWVLSMVLEHDDPRQIAELMTPGIIRGYEAYEIEHAYNTTLVPSSNQTKQLNGLVLFGLSQAGVEAVENYLGLDPPSYLRKDIADVEISLSGGETRTIGAVCYPWNGARTLLRPWSRATSTKSTSNVS